MCACVYPFIKFMYRKDNHVTNVKIYNKGTVYDVGGGLQFTCLSNLIDHYKRNPMAEMNGEVIQLNEVIHFRFLTSGASLGIPNDNAHVNRAGRYTGI